MDRNPKDLGLLIITSSLVNRPFASPLQPLFEGDSTCEVFVRISIFIHIEIRTNYHNKHFVLRLALKENLTELCYSQRVAAPSPRRNPVFLRGEGTATRKEQNFKKTSSKLFLFLFCGLVSILIFLKTR